ncbi:hypothetical protein K8R20_02190 [bacterium]|nr:hypothetical protein [bacterium]
MIKIKSNKNILFFFSLLAQLQPDQPYHPLGKKILKLINYSQATSYKNFQNHHNSYPIHPYRYALYAIHTNSDLSSKEMNGECGFGPKNSKFYTEKIYPVVKEIAKETNFNELITTEILPLHETLNKDIEKYFNGDVEKSIKKIWGVNHNNMNFILIPNIFELGHSFGLFRKNNIYSITSPYEIDNKTQFVQQSVISNAIHEFSHSIFKKNLMKNSLFQKHVELTKHIEVPKKLQKIHTTPFIYMEETLIKVVTQIIKEFLYDKNHRTPEEIKQKTVRSLDRITNRGYEQAYNLYEVLHNSENIVEDYLTFLTNNTQ